MDICVTPTNVTGFPAPHMNCTTNTTFPFDQSEKKWVMSVPKRSHVEADCRCAMNDTDTGYCSSVIGTEFYSKAMRAELYVLGESKCHTLDRDNIRA